MKRIFVTGVPVTGKHLVGRSEELHQIMHLLRNGQSVVVIAPRRFGKTSLILTALNKLKAEGNYTASIDLFTISNRERLAQKIIEATLENKKIFNLFSKFKTSISTIFKNIQIRQTVEKYEIILKFTESSPDVEKLLEESLDFPQLFAKREKKDIFFFYDEFGDIGKFNGEKTIKLLRGKFQLHSNVCYLFAGSQESLMNELFADKKSAFYKFGRIIFLEEVPFAEFKKYVIKEFEKENIYISETVVEHLLDLTRCHPYYTQLLCQHIYYLAKGEKNIIQLRDLKNGYEMAFNSEKIYLEKLWEELASSSSQIYLLIELAKGEENIFSLEKKSQINVSRVVKSLAKKGIIKKRKQGKYGIIDPFFERYILKNT